MMNDLESTELLMMPEHLSRSVVYLGYDQYTIDRVLVHSVGNTSMMRCFRMQTPYVTYQVVSLRARGLVRQGFLQAAVAEARTKSAMSEIHSQRCCLSSESAESVKQSHYSDRARLVRDLLCKLDPTSAVEAFQEVSYISRTNMLACWEMTISSPHTWTRRGS